MAKICGLLPNHAPHLSFKSRLSSPTYDFFSDTPVFCPKHIESVLETDGLNPKFIYIERNFDELFNSWKTVKLLDNYKRMLSSDYDTMRPSMKFDLTCYDSAFNGAVLSEDNYVEVFRHHKQTITSLILDNQKDLLFYKFGDGWEPFCNFVDAEIPTDPLPELNKNKMFDEI